MEHLTQSDDIETTCVVMLTVLSAMLDYPEVLSIVPLQSTSGVVLRVRCDPSDVCKLIGKQGRTARALRTVLMALSKRNSYHLEIAQPSPDIRNIESTQADGSALCFA